MHKSLRRFSRVRLLEYILIFLILTGLFSFGSVGSAGAMVFLYPEATIEAGLAGSSMAGARVALAGGADGVVTNPAGLAKGSGALLSVSPSGLQREVVNIGDAQNATIHAIPSGFSWSTAGTGEAPRFGYGFFVAMPVNRQYRTRIDTTSSGGMEILPSQFSVSGIWPETDPLNLTVRETGEGFGRMVQLDYGLGIGFQISNWARLGGSIWMEQVSLEQHSTYRAKYAGTGEESGAPDFSATSEINWFFRGQSLRRQSMLGVQLDLSRSLTLGVALRSASSHRGGHAEMGYSRSEKMELVRTGYAPFDSTAYVEMENPAGFFRLDSPQEFHIGLALRSDVSLMELDWVEISPVDAYQVAPGMYSQPPSTVAMELPPLQTSAGGGQRWAFGMAITGVGADMILMGMFHQTSGVPARDPLFRKVSQQGASAGYLLARGAFSAVFSLDYRTVVARDAQYPVMGEDRYLAMATRLEMVTVATGFSYFF